QLLQERGQLETRSKALMQKQRSAESMLTDLTRSIKQMESDIEQMRLLQQESPLPSPSSLPAPPPPPALEEKKP
ncbi:hypothetical protein KR222_007610, partial [Zaprionus bogoriensis]